LHKTGGPVHVPHPGVVHGDLEKDLAVVRGPHLQVHVVGEVEPALRLPHMGEQADDVPVLAVELQLHLRFVLLQVLRAHGSILPPPADRRGRSGTIGGGPATARAPPARAGAPRLHTPCDGRSHIPDNAHRAPASSGPWSPWPRSTRRRPTRLPGRPSTPRARVSRGPARGSRRSARTPPRCAARRTPGACPRRCTRAARARRSRRPGS